MTDCDWNELRARLMRGEGDAERELERRLGELPVFSEPEDAHGAMVSEVAHRVMRRLSSESGRRRLEQVRDLRAFCLRMAIDHASERVRRLLLRRAPWLEPDLAAALDDPEPPAAGDRIRERNLREEVLGGLGRLDAQEVKILKMAWLEGLDAAAITRRLRANGLGLTEKTVATHLARGRERLRTALRRRGLLGPPGDGA